MVKTRESLQRIFDFQRFKSKELKRPVTFSEAIALWFSQTGIQQENKTKRKRKYSKELVNV